MLFVVISGTARKIAVSSNNVLVAHSGILKTSKFSVYSFRIIFALYNGIN